MELPEKRLKNMLKNNTIDQEFLNHIEDRIPIFLTATLVNITKTLLSQKDLFREHKIWKKLEIQFLQRRRFLDNDQLATVLSAFGLSGSGSNLFYRDMEEMVTDSPIPIENDNLVKILNGYAEIDQGSALIYQTISEKIQARGLDEFEKPSQITAIAKTLSKATNVQAGGFGFYAEMEKHIKQCLHGKKFPQHILDSDEKSFDELCKLSSDIFQANVCTNAF